MTGVVLSLHISENNFSNVSRSLAINHGQGRRIRVIADTHSQIARLP